MKKPAAEEKDPTGRSPQTPGAKLDKGKVQAGLLLQFSNALNAMAEVATFGAGKYTRGGWKVVPNAIERYSDAQFRHALARGAGEVFDKDSGLLHLAHEVWNAMAVLEFTILEMKKAQNDNDDCDYWWMFLLFSALATMLVRMWSSATKSLLRIKRFS